MTDFTVYKLFRHVIYRTIARDIRHSKIAPVTYKDIKDKHNSLTSDHINI